VHPQPYTFVYSLGRLRFKFVRWGMTPEQVDSCQLQDIRVHVATTVEHHVDEDVDESS
jgi:hypothetical protein